MKKIMTGLAMIGLATMTLSATPEKATAASNAECGIWLCLPGGFGAGCAPSYKEFIKRITHKPKPKPPLPPYSGCSGGKGNGSYVRGFESHETCRAGFTARDYYDEDRGGYSSINSRWNSPESRQCVNLNNCRRTYGEDGGVVCESYTANRRNKPHYIQITVDGQTYDKYYFRY